jgi:hypothetical protein
MKVYLMRLVACLFVSASSNSLAALVDKGTFFANTEIITHSLKLSQAVNSSWTGVVTNDALELSVSNEHWLIGVALSRVSEAPVLVAAFFLTDLLGLSLLRDKSDV